jgi:hypothetical protein
VPENIENKEGKAALIILDDLLTEVYSEKVRLLFTRGCHHRNISDTDNAKFVSSSLL